MAAALNSINDELICLGSHERGPIGVAAVPRPPASALVLIGEAYQLIFGALVMIRPRPDRRPVVVAAVVSAVLQLKQTNELANTQEHNTNTSRQTALMRALAIVRLWQLDLDEYQNLCKFSSFIASNPDAPRVSGERIRDSRRHRLDFIVYSSRSIVRLPFASR
jgi:hypothetical protein